jgi:membrane protein YdbS with pleckstrin-like domain
MSAPTAPRRMPRLLKATYLADQETLLDETRATGLFYFPGPILWLLVFGALTWLTEAARLGWMGQIPAYSHLIHKMPKGDARLVAYFFGFLVFVGLIFLAVRYLRWMRTVYAVTNRRVIIQRGILSRDFDEIPVLQVRGVDVHQSVGQRILGYGTIRVSSEGGSRLGNEDWNGIPRPFRFQKLIEDATANAAGPNLPR